MVLAAQEGSLPPGSCPLGKKQLPSPAATPAPSPETVRERAEQGWVSCCTSSEATKSCHPLVQGFEGSVSPPQGEQDPLTLASPCAPTAKKKNFMGKTHKGPHALPRGAGAVPPALSLPRQQLNPITACPNKHREHYSLPPPQQVVRSEASTSPFGVIFGDI